MAANPDRKTGTPRLRRTTENTLRRKWWVAQYSIRTALMI
jgi:hypothetical protein